MLLNLTVCVCLYNIIIIIIWIYACIDAAGQWLRWRLFQVCNQDQRSKLVWQLQLASTATPVALM